MLVCWDDWVVDNVDVVTSKAATSALRVVISLCKAKIDAEFVVARAKAVVPIGSNKLIGPSGPCEPCEPCGPCGPCDPCEPCDPCDPCGPWTKLKTKSNLVLLLVLDRSIKTVADALFPLGNVLVVTLLIEIFLQ